MTDVCCCYVAAVYFVFFLSLVLSILSLFLCVMIQILSCLVRVVSIFTQQSISEQYKRFAQRGNRFAATHIDWEHFNQSERRKLITDHD